MPDMAGYEYAYAYLCTYVGLSDVNAYAYVHVYVYLHAHVCNDPNYLINCVTDALKIRHIFNSMGTSVGACYSTSMVVCSFKHCTCVHTDHNVVD